MSKYDPEQGVIFPSREIWCVMSRDIRVRYICTNRPTAAPSDRNFFPSLLHDILANPQGFLSHMFCVFTIFGIIGFDAVLG